MKNRFLIPFKQSRSTKSHKPPSPNLSNTTPDLEWHKEHDAALTCLYSHTNTLQTPKTREKKTLALEKQQEVPLIRMKKRVENNFKKENFFVLERCLNMISHFRYPIFLLNINRTSAEWRQRYHFTILR